MSLIRDDQARQRLVEIAIDAAASWAELTPYEQGFERRDARSRAGFRDPSKGHWCAAGLTAAMEDAGLVVPEPGTSARRGAIALLDFLRERSALSWCRFPDIEPDPDDYGGVEPGDIIAWLQYPLGKDPAGWRRGHVAVIVAVDDDSIATVGWNEGPSPGRVRKLLLWRSQDQGAVRVQRSMTVLYRRPGGLYGIARPVAR